MDHIEWDLLSPLTPEAFAIKLCTELGLVGEAIPLVAHAVHEELMKHKKDAIEWGVIGGERGERGEGTDDHAGGEKGRDRSGYGLVKDKTGLGLGLGRAPRDGRGPKTLRSTWRDWAEADEFRTIFEELTAEDIEKREIERERSTRCVFFFIGVVLFIFPTRFSDVSREKPRNFKVPLAADGDRLYFYFILFIAIVMT